MSIQNIGRNKWRVVVKAGINPDTGKTKYIDRIVSGSKEEAIAFETTISGDGGHAPANITLGEYFDLYWVPSLKVQASTKEQYLYSVKRLSALHHIKLSRLTAYDIERAIHSLPPGNQRREARKVLSVALNAAVRWNKLYRNPLQTAQIAVGQGVERKWEAYTAEELQAVLRAIRGDVCEPVAIVMAFCGLRKEEALALDWQDIDLDGGVVSVHSAWAMNGKEPMLKEPKTKSSKRDTYISGWGLKRLGEIGQGQQGAIWPGKLRRRITPHAATRHFQRAITRSGLRYVPLNGLRHAYSTLSLSSGIDVALVSKSLGHTRISTTVNAYVRPLEAARVEAADKFAQAMGQI